MVDFVKKDVVGFSPEQKAQLQSVIVAVSAEAGLKNQRTLDARDAAIIDQGKKFITNATVSCTDCHQFHNVDKDAVAPDLTNYGSREWLAAFISDPGHDRFYGASNDRMPAFGANQRMSAQEIGLLTDWLRGDWYEPEGEKAKD